MVNQTKNTNTTTPFFFFCSEIFGKLLLSLEYSLLQGIKYIIKAVLKF